MRNIKRFIVALIIFTGFNAFSFGESFYGFTTGLYRVSEVYLNEDFSREQTGISGNFFYYYFPRGSFLGIFAQTAIGSLSSGYEWNNDDMVSLDTSSVWDLRFSLAPSFKLQPGSRLRIPFSVGPVVSIYREEGWNSWLSDKKTFYEALSLGVQGDVSIILNPSRWFFLRHGVTVSWDFLRTERGEMSSEFRNRRSAQFSGVAYSAVLASIYFGMGIRFAQ